jgi:hypothetical protein
MRALGRTLARPKQAARAPELRRSLVVQAGVCLAVEETSRVARNAVVGQECSWTLAAQRRLEVRRLRAMRRRCLGSTKVCAAGEVLVYSGSGQLVETKPLPTGTSEGRARAERQLQSGFRLQPARAECCERLVEV